MNRFYNKPLESAPRCSRFPPYQGYPEPPESPMVDYTLLILKMTFYDYYQKSDKGGGGVFHAITL